MASRKRRPLLLFHQESQWLFASSNSTSVCAAFNARKYPAFHEWHAKFAQYTEFGNSTSGHHIKRCTELLVLPKSFSAVMETLHVFLTQASPTNVFKNVMRLFNESTIVTFKSGKTIFSGILGKSCTCTT